MTPLSKKVFKQEAITFVIIAVLFIAQYFIFPIGNETNINSWFYKWYWLFAGIILFLLFIYFIWGFIRATKNKNCIPVKIADKTIKYGFLLKQLVARDFKRKYKRSVLGILWSLLNPLLSMLVQYLIFSTLFGNQSIECFPVYLLIGVVFFSFASEACLIGLTAITDNGMLVKKVYVPKYIYPLSRVISSLINFALALIPLFVIMAICRIVPAWTMLLFFPVTLLLFVFCYGMALILSTIMVFFRDIQFLWGVFNMIWMYATPIFYDVNQISNKSIQILIKLNPLYHYITAIRFSFIQGVSPDIKTIAICFGISAIALVLGIILFKKNQDKFAFHV